MPADLSDSTPSFLADLARQTELLAEQVAVFTANSARSTSTITVAQFVPAASASIINERTRDTYGTGFRRLAEVGACVEPNATGAPRDASACAQICGGHRPLGELLLHEVTGEQLERLLMWTLRRTQAVARGRSRRALLAERRVHVPDTTLDDISDADVRLPLTIGHGAVRSLLHALNYFFTLAVERGHLATSPVSSTLKRRFDLSRSSTAGARALHDSELDHLQQIAMTDASDSELWRVLIWLHLESGARMGEAIRLRPSDLNPDRQTILLGKKGDKERYQPVSAALIETLLTFAVSRGVMYDHEPLLRARYGTKPVALGESHYTAFWKTVRRGASWADTDVTTHSLRKSMAQRLERNCGERVAEAFLGHGRRSTDSNTPYLRVSGDELALAIEVVTGLPHPLAATEAKWLPHG